MSKIVGVGEQQVAHYLFDASGTITTGGTAQLVLPQHPSRSVLMFVNNSANTMYLDFGCGYAHCTLTNGAVSSVTVDNAGFNFTQPPRIRFLGGGYPQVTLASGQAAGYNSSYVSAGGPNFPAPPNCATAVAVLASSSIAGKKINSITVTNGGSNYAVAPFVQIIPSDLDPNGVVIPASTNATSIKLPAGASLSWIAGMCPTDALSVVSSSTSDAFTCKYMT